MKKYMIISIAVAILFSFGQYLYAQNLKDLKNKTEKTAKNLNINSNKNESKNNSNSNSNSNTSNTEVKTETNNNSNSDDNSNVQPDDNFKEWFRVKYVVIADNEYTLDIYDLEQGQMDPSKAIEGLKILDYDNTIKTMNEKKLLVKSSLEDYQVERMMQYKDHFTKSFKEVYKSLINGKIEEAYKSKKDNEGYAVKIANEVKKYMEAMMLMIPQEPEVLNLKKDVDATSKNILDPYYNRIYTSNFHREHAGKILFSNKPIVIGKEDPAQFKTTFLPTENIYAVAYLDGKIKDLGGAGTGAYKVYMDDNNIPVNINFGHNDGDENLSYYLIEIIPQPDLAYHGLDPVEFGKILSGLSPRNHTMRLDFGGDYTSFSSGTITLDWATADGDKIMANNNLAAKNAQDNWARNMKLPEVYGLTTEKYNDPDMSTEKIKAMILNNDNFKNKISQLIKLQISGFNASYSNEDWIVYTNDLGIPTHKSSNRYIGIVYKGADGWCYFTECIYFIRDYEGGGTYSKPRLAYSGDVLNTKIDCKNVK